MRRRGRVAVSAGMLVMVLGCVEPVLGQSTITFLEVALDEETRTADERLRQYLAFQTERVFVTERPLEYDVVVNRLADWTPERGPFLARVTPYAFVASELLGAAMSGIATYVSAATGGTAYHAYFVVNRDRFSDPPDLSSLVDFVRSSDPPVTFAYHSKFSTSSYFLPALFFRSHGIYHMPVSTPYHTAIHSREFGSSSSDLVRAVADGRFDLAAVWDATKVRFEESDSLFTAYGSRVHFVQLPTPLPNDLLVVSESMDAATREAIQEAIRVMPEGQISEGDFLTWRDLGTAGEAREALANLRWLGRELPAPVTVDVRRADRGSPAPDSIIESVRQAVRLASGEFVNYDDDFHAHRDYVWTVEFVRGGTIALASRITGSQVDDQRFLVSFRDHEDLTRRIGNLLHSDLHRIRYVWPYRPERPTILRDLGLTLPAGSTVLVRRIQWLDAQRNYFLEDAEFEATVAHADFFKLELQPNFIRPPTDGGFGFDPMSNISYRVILVRTEAEAGIFRILTGALVLLLVAAGAAAIPSLRRNWAAQG